MLRGTMNFPERRFLSQTIVVQLVKYGAVGVVNTAIGFGLYVLFVKLGLQYLVASGVGYAIGAVNSYLLNRHWTFRAHNVSHASSAPRFALVQACAIGANIGLLFVFVHVAGVEKILGQAIVTLIVLSVTFVVNRLWSFAHEGEDLTGQKLAPQTTGR